MTQEEVWHSTEELLPMDKRAAEFEQTKRGLVSDGSTAEYYKLPLDATELQDLISYRNMNAQIGEIFRAGYRYGLASHSDQLRDAKKMRFYINAEIERLEKYEEKPMFDEHDIWDQDGKDTRLGLTITIFSAIVFIVIVLWLL